MVAGLCKANLVAEIDEIRGETQLGYCTECDEQEKIRVISCFEGGHRGLEKGDVLSDAAGIKRL